MSNKVKDKSNKQDRNNIEPQKLSNSENRSTSSIILEEEEACICPQPPVDDSPIVIYTPGLDPRFQQQNQTLRCYVMYTDFYRCEHILGEGAEACVWFKDVFTRICPNSWINRWDDYRNENRMPWFKSGTFPDGPYGK